MQLYPEFESETINGSAASPSWLQLQDFRSFAAPEHPTGLTNLYVWVLAVETSRGKMDIQHLS